MRVQSAFIYILYPSTSHKLVLLLSPVAKGPLEQQRSHLAARWHWCCWEESCRYCFKVPRRLPNTETSWLTGFGSFQGKVTIKVPVHQMARFTFAWQSPSTACCFPKAFLCSVGMFPGLAQWPVSSNPSHSRSLWHDPMIPPRMVSFWA